MPVFTAAEMAAAFGRTANGEAVAMRVALDSGKVLDKPVWQVPTEEGDLVVKIVAYEGLLPASWARDARVEPWSPAFGAHLRRSRLVQEASIARGGPLDPPVRAKDGKPIAFLPIDDATTAVLVAHEFIPNVPINLADAEAVRAIVPATGKASVRLLASLLDGRSRKVTLAERKSAGEWELSINVLRGIYTVPGVDIAQRPWVKRLLGALDDIDRLDHIDRDSWLHASHHDLNDTNMLWDGKNITIVDFDLNFHGNQRRSAMEAVEAAVMLRVNIAPSAGLSHTEFMRLMGEGMRSGLELIEPRHREPIVVSWQKLLLEDLRQATAAAFRQQTDDAERAVSNLLDLFEAGLPALRAARHGQEESLVHRPAPGDRSLA